MNEAVPFPDRKNQIKGQRKPRPEALGVHSLRRHPVFFFFFSQIFLFLFRFFFLFFWTFIPPTTCAPVVGGGGHASPILNGSDASGHQSTLLGFSLSLSLFLGKKKVHGVRGWGGGGGGSSVAFKARFFYWVVTEFCFVLFFALLALRSISGLWLSNRNRHHCSFFYFRFFTKDVWRASFIDGSYLNWVFLMRP